MKKIISRSSCYGVIGEEVPDSSEQIHVGDFVLYYAEGDRKESHVGVVVKETDNLYSIYGYCGVSIEKHMIRSIILSHSHLTHEILHDYSNQLCLEDDEGTEHDVVELSLRYKLVDETKRIFDKMEYLITKNDFYSYQRLVGCLEKIVRLHEDI
jgi:hypothetical protein